MVRPADGHVSSPRRPSYGKTKFSLVEQLSFVKIQLKIKTVKFLAPFLQRLVRIHFDIQRTPFNDFQM